MIQLSSPTRVTHILRRAQIEGAELADGVAVADFEPGRLAGLLLLVLRHLTDRVELEDPIVITDPCMTGNDHMRADRRVVADLDVFADDRIRADGDPGTQLGARMDDCCGMYHLFTRCSGNVALGAHQLGLRSDFRHRHALRPCISRCRASGEHFDVQMKLIARNYRPFKAGIVVPTK